MKKIEGYDFVYYVDEHSRIYDASKNPLPILNFPNKYYYCILVKEGKEVNRLCHILGAKAYVPNPEPEVKLLVNHKDLNRLNNHISNFEWVSHSENQVHQLNLRKPKKMKDKKLKELQAVIDSPHVSEAMKQKAKEAMEKIKAEPEPQEMREEPKEEKPKKEKKEKEPITVSEEPEESYEQLLDKAKKRKLESKKFKKKEESKEEEDYIGRAKAKAATRKNKKKK